MKISSARVEDFENALTPKVLRSLQIVSIFMAASIVLVGLAVLLVGMGVIRGAAPIHADPPRLIRLLSLTHVVLAVLQYAMAALVVKMQFGPKFGEREAADGAAAGEVWLNQIRSAHILRLACFQSVAFLGLIICLFGVLTGVMAAKPAYWANGLSAVVLLVAVDATFPTQKSLKKRFTTLLRRSAA